MAHGAGVEALVRAAPRRAPRRRPGRRRPPPRAPRARRAGARSQRRSRRRLPRRTQPSLRAASPCQTTAVAARTAYEKIWADHALGDDLLYVDMHLVHEVTSAQAFEGLRLAGRPVRRPDRTIATADHNVPTWEFSRPVEDDVARRRAGRGDGLRVAGRRRDHAGHVELAGGGHHARPRDRHPGAGRARAAAVLEGRAGRAAAGAGPGGRRLRAGDDGAVGAGCPRTGRGRGSRRMGRRQPARLPARATRGHPARAQRPGDPRRALPRRAGRLAPRRALPVRVEGQRAVGARDRGAAARAPRGGVPRVRRRRRHRAAAARRAGRLRVRSRAHGRGRAARSGRGRAGRGRRAGWVVAVRLAVPRVRGPRPAAPPT